MWVGYYLVLGVELNHSPDLSTLGGSGLGTRLHIHCYGYVSPANVRPIGGICRWNCDYGCLEKFCQAATSVRYVSICFPAASYLFCSRGCNRVLSGKTRSEYCVQTCTLALFGSLEAIFRAKNRLQNPNMSCTHYFDIVALSSAPVAWGSLKTIRLRKTNHNLCH